MYQDSNITPSYDSNSATKLGVDFNGDDETYDARARDNGRPGTGMRRVCKHNCCTHSFAGNGCIDSWHMVGRPLA